MFRVADTAFSYRRELIVFFFLQESSKVKESSLLKIWSTDTAFLRGEISLLSIAGKILERIILNRLYRPIGPPTRKSVWLQKRSWYHWYDFCCSSAPREVSRAEFGSLYDLCGSLWAKFGCPEKLITMVRQFHYGMMVTVQDQNASSATFPVTNGVKQGCVLALTLFSMMFLTIIQDAFASESNYRFDGSLFNFRRLQAKTKIQEGIAHESFFADDSALAAGSEAVMQRSVNLFSPACDFGNHQHQENWSYVPISYW